MRRNDSPVSFFKATGDSLCSGTAAVDGCVVSVLERVWDLCEFSENLTSDS